MLRRKIDVWQSNIRLLYYFIYVVVTAVVFFVPVRGAMAGADGKLFTVLGVLGVFLIALDFFTKRNLFKIFHADILVLYFIICLMGIVINRQFSFFSNIKGMMWVAIQIFFLATVEEGASKNDVLTWFYRLADLFVTIWLAGVIWSLGQYVVQFSDTWNVLLDGTAHAQRVGFINGRLFGIFIDPNYASICSLVAIALAAVNLKCAKRTKPVRVYYIVSIVLQVFYVILSGSRTGMIAAMITAAFCAAFLFTNRFARKNWGVNTGMFVVVFALSVVVVWGGCRLTQGALSYVPSLRDTVASITQQEPTDSTKPSTDRPPLKRPSRVDLTREDVQENSDYTNNRSSIWKDCLRIVKTTPLFGATARGYMELAKERIPDSMLVAYGYSVHNGYLMLLVATGILGLCVMMLWVGLIVWKVIRYLICRWKTKDQYYWPVFISSMALAVIAISAFPLQSIFFSNQIPDTMFWLILGFVMCFIRCSEPEENRKKSIIFRVTEKLFAKK